mmetsp:Transcript_3111/g.2587  ORF Transcript_3111/g.2587 Transcript_3111/m.2587 type:complete len:163 (+) Transcript_3111:873-1361(+)
MNIQPISHHRRIRSMNISEHTNLSSTVKNTEIISEEEQSSTPLSKLPLSYTHEDLNIIIDTILKDQELKEFFYDLIINEQMISSIPLSLNKEITAQNSVCDNETNFSIPLNKERLKSSTGERKYGQQLYPRFFKDARAVTANTSAVRQRKMRQLSNHFLKKN